MAETGGVILKLWSSPCNSCVSHLLLQLIVVSVSLGDVCIDAGFELFLEMDSLELVAVDAVLPVLQWIIDDDLLEIWEAGDESASVGDTSVNPI